MKTVVSLRPPSREMQQDREVRFIFAVLILFSSFQNLFSSDIKYTNWKEPRTSNTPSQAAENIQDSTCDLQVGQPIYIIAWNKQENKNM